MYGKQYSVHNVWYDMQQGNTEKQTGIVSTVHCLSLCFKFMLPAELTEPPQFQETAYYAVM